MKTTLMLGAALCLLSTAASAGYNDPPTGKPAAGGATTLSQGQIQTAASTSRVVNVINVPAVGPDPTQRPSGGGRAGSGGVNIDATSAPSIAGPSLYSADNCIVGITLFGSAKAGGGGWGIQWEADDCKRARRAKLMGEFNRPDVGIEIECKEPSMDVRYAMAARGTPCDEDRKVWIKAGWTPSPDPSAAPTSLRRGGR